MASSGLRGGYPGDARPRQGPILDRHHAAPRAGPAPASATELIDRLERRGLVRRGLDERDRWRVLVDLVPDAIPEIATAFERFGESIGKLWGQYTAGELALIHRFLVEATERMRAEATAAPTDERPETVSVRGFPARPQTQ